MLKLQLKMSGFGVRDRVYKPQDAIWSTTAFTQLVVVYACGTTKIHYDTSINGPEVSISKLDNTEAGNTKFYSSIAHTCSFVHC